MIRSLRQDESAHTSERTVMGWMSSKSRRLPVRPHSSPTKSGGTGTTFAMSKDEGRPGALFGRAFLTRDTDMGPWNRITRLSLNVTN